MSNGAAGSDGHPDAGWSRRDLTLGALAALAPLPAHAQADAPRGFVNVAEFRRGGADDTAAIQAAIDAAPDGGCVFFPHGLYRISRSLSLARRAHLELRGSGEACIFSPVNARLLTVVDCSNITLRKLTFRGVGRSENNGQAGVGLWGTCRNFRAFECAFADLGHDAIHALHSVDGFTVAYCHVDGCGDDGINPGGSIAGPSTRRSIISGNVIENVVNDGVHISAASSETVVTNNTIRNCGRGIGFVGASRAIVIGNTIRDCSEAGVITEGLASNDFIIADNFFEGCERGIRLSLGSARWRLVDNIIRSSGAQGILITNPPGAPAIVDGRIAGNLISGGCATAGIHLLSAAHCSVDGNTLADLSGVGVRVSGGEYGCADILVKDNQLRGIRGQRYWIADGPGVVLREE